LVKIRTECTNVGLPEPTFTFNRHGLMVHFRGRTMNASEKAAGVSEKTSEKMEKPSEKSAEASEKTSEKILELIKDDPEITIRELAFIVGVSDRSIERNLQKLQKDNLLKRVGADKGGRWEVLE
jgi:ATP-dependent DNA helicase RecG